MNKKIYIFLIISALLNKQIITKEKNNNSFRPGIDNPYELKKKSLNDQELAEKSAVEEKVNALIKLIKKYNTNYRNYISNQEPVINTLKLISSQPNQTMEETLIFLTGYLQALSKQNNSRAVKAYNIKEEIHKIKNQIKISKIEYKEKLKYLNDEKKKSIESGIIIDFCNKKIQAYVPMAVQYENPGIQNAYSIIFENQLIQNGDTKNELALLVYFFTKEYLGELRARLEGIKK